MESFRRTYFVVVTQLIPLSVTDRDDGGTPRSQVTFDSQKDPRFDRVEVGVKNVPVKGMDHYRYLFVEGRQSSQGSRFRGVGMHDVGTVFPDDGAKTLVGRAVVGPRQFPLHLRKLDKAEAKILHDVLRTLFRVLLNTGNQQGFEFGRHVPGQQGRVVGGPTQVETVDDAEYAWHWRCKFEISRNPDRLG